MTEGVSRYDATWQALSKHLHARIAELQRLLERPATVEDTALLRGRIAEIRHLIDEVEPAERSPDQTRDRPPRLY